MEVLLDSNFRWKVANIEWEARQLVILKRGKDLYDELDPIVQERYRKLALSQIRKEMSQDKSKPK